jgi:hypothetical protein
MLQCKRPSLSPINLWQRPSTENTSRTPYPNNFSTVIETGILLLLPALPWECVKRTLLSNRLFRLVVPEKCFNKSLDYSVLVLYIRQLRKQHALLIPVLAYEFLKKYRTSVADKSRGRLSYPRDSESWYLQQETETDRHNKFGASLAWVISIINFLRVCVPLLRAPRVFISLHFFSL